MSIHEHDVVETTSETLPPQVVPAADTVPASRLWTLFVLGWVPVLGYVIWTLLQIRLGTLRLALTLPALVALTGLFLWLTLRGALANNDLMPIGPSVADLRRRLLILAAMAAIVIGLILLIPQGGVWWLFMYAVIAAGLALPARLAIAVIAVFVALAIGSGWIATGNPDVMLLVQLAMGAGAITIRHLTILVSQLHAAREEVAHLAVAEERLRFARDLHDLLGHSLSVIVLKAELAGRLLPAAPERATPEIADVERTAREALRQVRVAVAGYRQPVLHGELAAARELLSAAGIAAQIEHQTTSLPPALDGLLAWTVREGITNVIRHSRARHCMIRIRRLSGSVQVEVTDDGQVAGSKLPETGNGLAGLAERAAALGGTITAGPLPGKGFGLVLNVPDTSVATRGAA